MSIKEVYCSLIVRKAYQQLKKADKAFLVIESYVYIALTAALLDEGTHTNVESCWSVLLQWFH